ncbi:metallophosphoesterase [Hymenobacter coalescens]
MSYFYRPLVLAGLLLTAALPARPQSVPAAHHVYLLGNTAGPVPEARLQALRRTLEQETTPFTVVHLGDIVGNEGLSDKQDTTRAGLETRANALLALVRGLPNGRIYFVPGDKDWNNSGRDGQKSVRRLEKYIEQQLGGQNAFIPSNGCPGPEIVDVAPLVRLVALNTPWWSHPFDRPEAPDTDCKTMSAEEFREQLQDVIDDTKGRNVLLVGHQPALSNGTYGGFQPLKRHLSPPIFGTINAAYRQNVGTPRDMASPGYQAFKKTLLSTLKEHPGVVYAAAHDFSLQLTPFERNYHLVSGSFAHTEPVGNNARSLYNAPEAGYTRLDYYPDGTVKTVMLRFDRGSTAREDFTATLFQSACLPSSPATPTNAFLPDCPAAPKGPAASRPAATSGPTATVTPGPQYRAHGLQQALMGPLYRSSWTQPVTVSVLDLNTEKGGLRPTGRGGGRQTTSLKMIAADSSEYTFRSVDKDVTKILPPELRGSVAADILRDITPTANPYSALVIAPLLDRTDILHARPRLFVLPDNQQLGPYRERYAGLLGTLEDDPWDQKDNLPGFGGAQDVRRSFSMYRQLYKDHDNRVDAVALGRARAFDMLVADFGKHDDNWKWAGYEDGNKTIFKPIPRDRDQAFTLWNGALTWVANREWAVPSIEDFQAKFNDLESLNWPARHLDRALLPGLNRADWQRIGQYLQQRITPGAIDSATAQLPREIQGLSGQDINRKLKSRIQELPQAIVAYYLMLARDVDVVGSNKAEHFLVERLPDGNVRVQVSKKADDGTAKGPPFFDRTFVQGETRDIRLYGLDGKDVFRVTGQGRRSIRVRIIGGEGGDMVSDDSRGGRTEVYDVPKTDLQPGPGTADRRSLRLGVNRYDRRAFEYDGYAPRGGLLYNRNDGFGVAAGFDWVKQGFRKPDYRVRYGLDAQYTTGGNRQLTGNVRWRYLIGKWDAGARATYGNFFPFYNFFGLGNATGKNNALFDANFYRARYRGYQTEAFLERAFRGKSYVRLGPVYEQYQSDFASTSYIGLLKNPLVEPVPGTPVPDTDFQRLLGGRAVVDLDFRDRKLFARRGVRLYGEHTTWQQLNQGQRTFGLTEAFAEYLATARLGIPVTLAVKGGGGKNYGPSDEIPFYKFTQLGQRQNLRGYVRNRFTGDASLYLNSELRLALGYANTSILPFYYGLFGFYDQGQVYYRGEAAGGWHRGYGGGFYIAPVYETFALSVSVQHSAEEAALLQFGLGFRIDQ